MKSTRTVCLSLTLLGLAACSPDNNIQSSYGATHYFENELNFTTNPHGVHSAIQEKQSVVIVDVRAEKDYEAGHIPGAINLPFTEWESFTGKQTFFPGLRKDVINFVYCYELLCNLGQKAAKKFASLGYPVKEMKGGFKSWKEHNYLVEAQLVPVETTTFVAIQN